MHGHGAAGPVRQSGGGDPGDRLSEECRTEVADVGVYTPGVERAGIATANSKKVSVER